jgi:hypothetical protein
MIRIIGFTLLDENKFEAPSDRDVRIFRNTNS